MNLGIDGLVTEWNIHRDSLEGDGRHLTLCTKKNLWVLACSGPKETRSISPTLGTIFDAAPGTETRKQIIADVKGKLIIK